MATISIFLPPSLQAYVDEQVAQRGYGNGAEFIRLLIRRDRARGRLRLAALAGEGHGRRAADPAGGGHGRRAAAETGETPRGRASADALDAHGGRAAEATRLGPQPGKRGRRTGP